MVAGSFETYTRLLADGAADDDGVRAVVLLGSASDEARARRDTWSDHDFYALLQPDPEVRLRARLGFLPLQDRVVLVAQEGTNGFSVLYDDGHLFEFGIGTAAELAGARFGPHQVLTGGDVADRFVAGATRPVGPPPETAADHAGLTLVKLLVGYGRARRGERLSAGEFVRTYAVKHLTHTVRLRIAPRTGDADPFDPARRFEQDYPEVAARVAEAVDEPLEAAARSLLRVLREELEPDWPDFPSVAADVVTARLAE